MTNETRPEAPPEQPASDHWRQAIESRKTAVAEPEKVRATQATPVDHDASRRNFIKGAFWVGLGSTLLGSVGLFLDFFWPRNVRGFGGPVPAGNVAEYPRGGEPRHFGEGQFWISNLDPGEARPGGSGGGEGLLALWRKCPHLGCTVPWRGNFNYEGDDGGWFRCPCHGSTYTKAGIRVFGPAARSMDTMAVEVDDAGNITVQTGEITPGGPDNPQRAVSHPLLPT